MFIVDVLDAADANGWNDDKNDAVAILCYLVVSKVLRDVDVHLRC